MKTKEEMQRTARQLISQMTLEEKTGMLHGTGLFHTQGIPRLGIPPLKMSDGPMGVRSEFENGQWKQIGLPDDYVTYLPSGTAVASTWNPDLAGKVGEVLGEEARGRGKDVILAPSVNLKRSPLCGRNFEYMSEDPYLTASLAVPLIRGIQQSDVSACVKHFALNNQETNRLEVDVKADKRAVHELYLPAFRACEKVSYSLMSAYNRIDGEYCSHNKPLLTDLLRKKWGYDGTVISDWGAVHDTTAPAEAGLDIEMSVTDNFEEYYFAQPLCAAVRAGKVSDTLLDQKLENILVLMQRLHMLGGEKRKPGCYDTLPHQQATLAAAREAVVLLKNEDRLLPLAKGAGRILVIGDNAVRAHAPGGGSAEIKALYEITPLLGIRTVLGGETDVRWVPGYAAAPAKAQDENWQADSLKDHARDETAEDRETAAQQKTLRDEAVHLAGQYDRVVLVCGLSHLQDTEGADRPDMRLPYGQDQLISEVLKANPNAVVALIGGSPMEMPWLPQAKAVLWSSYAGMEGGRALAEVLFGEVNPSGHLPETFAKNLTDYSSHSIGEFPGGKSVDYKEGIFVGYRHFDAAKIEPAFCFGHGLSYTTFAYTDLQEKLCETEQKLQLTLSCQIQNTGRRAGKETVQFYVAAPQNDRPMPVRALCGFQKLAVVPGETARAEVTVPVKCLSFYDTALGAFVAEPGEYRIFAGCSSRDLRLQGTVQLQYRHVTTE
ncbi:MAG: glycoside hydrolase family 3 C-terminal domain-containing protein [Oscillospiraceae bacterium]|jgi:beta-glucosidase|nr:glycoside hydrolase family 3 C-terminal domain-containing protein [Oscillospiraceae bacterium]MDD3261235.1 glycoside hydrolase family 3 C-terminal domain-containing protein [Oscillospiraceae bacterium]